MSIEDKNCVAKRIGMNKGLMKEPKMISEMYKSIDKPSEKRVGCCSSLSGR